MDDMNLNNKNEQKGNGWNDYLPLFRNNISNTKGRHNSGILRQSKLGQIVKWLSWQGEIYIYIKC